MQTETEFQDCAAKLKALSQSTRLRIINELFVSRRNVSELCELLDESMVNVSHHLQVLWRADILKSSMEGREVYYYLHPSVVVAGKQVNLGCCCLDLER